MQRTCDDCGAFYDDIYRFTICPHGRFEMATTVMRKGGVVGVATTLEELDRLVDERDEDGLPPLPPPGGPYGFPKWMKDHINKN